MTAYGFRMVYDAGDNAEVLAKDLENSRILLYSYNSAIIQLNQAYVTQTNLESDAQALCATLAAERSKTSTVSPYQILGSNKLKLKFKTERPVIFVAHSLGGLICAQAQVIGDRGTPEDNSWLIAQNTIGLIFLGTSFRGSKHASLGETVRRILGRGLNAQKETLKHMTVDSEKLNELGSAFPAVVRKRNESGKPNDKIGIMFFRENLLTHGLMIVEEWSAQIPGCGESVPINANHLDICKFNTTEDQGYMLVLAAIRKFMAKSGSGESAEQSQVISNIKNYGKAQYMGHTINVTCPQTNNF